MRPVDDLSHSWELNLGSTPKPDREPPPTGTEAFTLLSPCLWNCLTPAGVSSEPRGVQAGEWGNRLGHLHWVPTGSSTGEGLRAQPAGQGALEFSPEGQPHPTAVQVQELSSERPPWYVADVGLQFPHL